MKNNIYVINNKSPEELMKKYGKSIINQPITNFTNKEKVSLEERDIRIVFRGINSLEQAPHIAELMRKNINNIEKSINNGNIIGVLEQEDKLTIAKWKYENNELIVNV